MTRPCRSLWRRIHWLRGSHSAGLVCCLAAFLMPSEASAGALFLGQKFAVGVEPLSVAAADLNGDSSPDVVTANAASDDVSVLLNLTPGPDRDGDGIRDAEDNCTEVANADQRDTDRDGYGNLCDADLNNDGSVDFLDLGLFKAVFFTGDADADLNGDGSVDFLDLGLMKAGFFQAPGPSGLGDSDMDGFTVAAGDCDDTNSSVFPGAPEDCDDMDSDCDGSLVDAFFDNDDDGSADCIDDDDDDDGVPDASDSCPFIADTADCLGDADLDGVVDGDETAAARYNPNIGGPDTPEVCDGVDNDGDLLIDEGTGCTACN